MQQNMYVVFDVKAGAYLQPWFLLRDAMAVRAFGDCCNDAEHNFGRHPEDFTLFVIGSFDDQKAVIDWHAPRSLGNGIEFVVVDDSQPDLFTDGNPVHDLAVRNMDARKGDGSGEAEIGDEASVQSGAEGGNSQKLV